jgi:transcriptional regulator with PAS, ATPase and Fis domain
MKENIAADWRPDDRAAFYDVLLDSIKNPIVFCDMNDIMLYMNTSAVSHYGTRGGKSLIGQSVLDCHNPVSGKMIAEIKERFLAEPELDEVMITDNKKYRIWMRAVRENGQVIGYFERYEPPKGS